MTVTEEEIDQKVDQVLSRISQDYMEGILSQGELEKYRAQRLKNLCRRTVWVAVSHVRKGRIKDMFFETNFGHKGEFLPLKVPSKVGDAFVEGQIDRVDMLEGDFSKVIDYKSGQSGLKMDEVYAGRKLQLFIYLMATAQKDGIEPGGAFYFPVEDMADESTKMDGFVCDVDRVVLGIDQEEKVTKRIYKSGKERILSKSDFEQTLEKVRNKVDSMAYEITSGEIGAKPKNINKVSSCTYCKFKGVCKFDLSIDECK
jgi:ATP-dependent helicase/nuclease subunit B